MLFPCAPLNLVSLKSLELSFAKKSLRTLCESQVIAERQFGLTAAGKLRRRLADLRAATNVKELAAGRPHQLANARHMAVDLGDDLQLVFCANHNAIPMADTVSIDWAKVSRVQILRIESKK
jgi:hypothetical protein